MKSVFGTLVIGVIGLVVGGGVGFIGSMATMGPRAAATGMCLTADAAFRKGILTPDQARQLAPDIAKANTYFGNAINDWNLSVPESGAACQQLLQGLKAK